MINGMTKIKFESKVTAYPMPVCLAGANIEGNPNFMAVAWVSKVNSNPPMMMVALGKKQYTATGIKENGTFSINFPDKNLVAKTDYCGLISGREADKSEIFEVFYGELETAPMISECPICYELKLKETVELTGTNMFVGEIVAAYADERYVSDNKVDVIHAEPFLLVEGLTNEYIELGSHVAKAFSVGKTIDE
jgi:flavin reductase (DIM6/NTAB) family NADH-FMN oxidoreductase RutF